MTHHSNSALAAFSCLSLILLGCRASPTEGGGLGTSRLVIQAVGQVTDLKGAPVGLVSVRATAFREVGSCEVDPVAPPLDTVTDEDGNYSVTIRMAGGVEFAACVAIEATPPPELRLRSAFRLTRTTAIVSTDELIPVRVDITLVPL